MKFRSESATSGANVRLTLQSPNTKERARIPARRAVDFRGGHGPSTAVERVDLVFAGDIVQRVAVRLQRSFSALPCTDRAPPPCRRSRSAAIFLKKYIHFDAKFRVLGRYECVRRQSRVSEPERKQLIRRFQGVAPAPRACARHGYRLPVCWISYVADPKLLGRSRVHAQTGLDFVWSMAMRLRMFSISSLSIESSFASMSRLACARLSISSSRAARVCSRSWQRCSQALPSPNRPSVSAAWRTWGRDSWLSLRFPLDCSTKCSMWSL